MIIEGNKKGILIYKKSHASISRGKLTEQHYVWLLEYKLKYAGWLQTSCILLNEYAGWLIQAASFQMQSDAGMIIQCKRSSTTNHTTNCGQPRNVVCTSPFTFAASWWSSRVGGTIN